MVAALLYWFGEPIRGFIERRLTLLTTAFVVLLVGGFVVVRYLDLRPSEARGEHAMLDVLHASSDFRRLSASAIAGVRAADRRRRHPRRPGLRAHRRLHALPVVPAAALCLLPRHPGPGRGARPAARRRAARRLPPSWPLSASASLVNAGLGVYQAGAEWKFWDPPATCASPTELPTFDLKTMNLDRVPAACGVASWRFLGLSFAGWNAWSRRVWQRARVWRL